MLLECKPAAIQGTHLLLAGLLSLTVWRLFRPRFERGAQAVAFSVFTVAHAVFLTTALRCLYVPTAYAGSGKAVATPSLLVYGTTATYISIAVSRALGGGLKAAAKGLFGPLLGSLGDRTASGNSDRGLLLLAGQNSSLRRLLNREPNGVV
ncbi:hypothetical protein GGP66_002179 [Salinibacter ruber]|nr:hypothetical protein [Salinibacter ruber]MCS3674740.1 hypothetical protein [Salinibacter ruber]